MCAVSGHRQSAVEYGDCTRKALEEALAQKERREAERGLEGHAGGRQAEGE